MKYFDYAATTKQSEEILEVYKNVSEEYYMNNINDEKSRNLKNQVIQKVRDLLGIDDDYEVVFTGTGTEANNLAILGKFDNSNNKHFITTKIEHPSVLETFKYLEKQGNEVTYITPNKLGIIEVDDVVSQIKKNTALISIMTVNNEIGTAQPINSIFKEIKKINKEIVTMTDGVQALGKVKTSMKDVDLITFSAHKIFGPKGIGMLVKKKNMIFEQIIHGSKGTLRPGTTSLPLEVAFVNAMNKSVLELEENQKLISKIQEYFIKGLNKKKINYNINGYSEVGIVSLSLEVEALAETMAKILYNSGIVVSTRSACSQKSNVRSHVLKAIGLSDEQIDKTIRISFSYTTTYEEVDELIEEINNIYKRFKK